MMDYRLELAACCADMEAVAASGKYTLEAQVRAYDLLSALLEARENGALELPEEAVSAFCTIYGKYAQPLAANYDENALKEAAGAFLKPYEEACNESRFEAAAAASLHEFAKETFEIWQKGGIFSRRRALNALRERAGFRLESHRIGNYVAKTFDLMNEAHARFAKAQQATFSANVAYKVQSGLYGKIADFLTSQP